MSDVVYSVAVRNPNGSVNVLQVGLPEGTEPEDIINAVKHELPESKVILCNVKPIGPSPVLH